MKRLLQEVYQFSATLQNIPKPRGLTQQSFIAHYTATGSHSWDHTVLQFLPGFTQAASQPAGWLQVVNLRWSHSYVC